MAAGKWIVTNKAKEYIGDGTIVLDATATNSWKVRPLTSVFAATYAVSTILNFQHAGSGPLTSAPKVAGNRTTGANEYFTATAGSWPNASGTTMRFIPGGTVSWTATGGTFSPAYAMLYYDAQTSPTDPIVAFVDLQTGTNSAVDIAAGNTFQISLPTAGLFTQTGATDPT